MIIMALICLQASLIFCDKIYPVNFTCPTTKDLSEEELSYYDDKNLLLENLIPKFYWHPETDLSEANASFIGEDYFGNSGYAVAGVGDVNGDEFDDILIGAPGVNDSTGGSYLFFGRGSDDWLKDTSLSEANVTFLSEDSDDQSGFAVARAGDVNNDSFYDILISAPTADSIGTIRETVYVILGRSSWSSTFDLAQANIICLDVGGDLNFGVSIGGAGDFNKDDMDDFIIGLYTESTWIGRTFIVCGDQSWSATGQIVFDFDSLAGTELIITLDGEDSVDFSGYAVAGAGDVNQDGFDDVLISAPNDEEGGDFAGQIYLIFGRSVTSPMNIALSNADVSFLGENSDDRAGLSVAGAGDVNHDGFDDILIGAPYSEEGGVDAGQTYLIFGKPTSQWHNNMNLTEANVSFIGENSQDLSGCSISSAGDVNKDGYPDILIGAYNGGSSGGQAYLILGRPTANWNETINLLDADASFLGEYGSDRAGYAVADAGDVDNDGFSDILIGAPYNDEGETEGGQTYLILSTHPSVTINSPVPKTYSTNTITVDFSGKAENFWYYIASVDTTNQTWSSSVQRTLTDGTYTLHVYANDTFGIEVHSSVSFTIDTTPPIIVIDSPNAITYSSRMVSISLIGAADYYWYYIANIDSINYSWTSIFQRTFEDGIYTLHAYGNDSAGNIAHAITIFKIDTAPPLIDQPKDIISEEGNISCTITWTPTDSTPSSFLVTRNKTQVVGGPWTGEQIIVNVYSLPAGTYQYTCTVFDALGNSVSDTVIVNIISIQDTTNPSIDHPDDLTYEEGSTGHILKWNPSDVYPESFRVERNGIWVAGGPWHGEPVIIDIDGLTTGSYEYICIVYDETGNWVEDSVKVTVIDTTLPYIDHPTDILFVEGISSHQIVWNPSDNHPATYQIMKNGTTLEAGPWNGDSIMVNISGLSPGNYTFTCTVTDQSGNSNSDEVFVSVPLEVSSRSAWPPLFLILSALGLVIIMKRKA